MSREERKKSGINWGVVLLIGVVVLTLRLIRRAGDDEEKKPYDHKNWPRDAGSPAPAISFQPNVSIFSDGRIIVNRLRVTLEEFTAWEKAQSGFRTSYYSAGTDPQDHPDAAAAKDLVLGRKENGPRWTVTPLPDKGTMPEIWESGRVIFKHHTRPPNTIVIFSDGTIMVDGEGMGLVEFEDFLTASTRQDPESRVEIRPGVFMREAIRTRTAVFYELPGEGKLHPDAEAARTAARQAKVVVGTAASRLAIFADGRLEWNGSTIDLSTLRSRLREDQGESPLPEEVGDGIKTAWCYGFQGNGTLHPDAIAAEKAARDAGYLTIRHHS